MLKSSVRLYDYQRECLAWMIDRERSDEVPGGIVSLDMGLGKTLMTIATMSANPVAKTLIIVPTNIVSQWASEFAKFTDVDPLILDAHSSNKNKITAEILDPFPVVLAPLSIFGSMSNADDNVLMTYPFDRIVVDEAHLIRHKKTKSYKLIRSLDSRIKWALTGTPIVSDEKNFTSLLEFLGIFRVNLRYAAKEYLYRRVKEDVVDLPALVIEDLRSDFETQLEKDAYADLISDGRSTLKAYKAYADSEGRMELLKLLLRLRQCTANVNMVPIDDGEDDFYDGPSTKLRMLENDICSTPMQKTIIFAHFHKEMNHIKDMLASHGHSAVALNGKITHDERVAAIEKFETDSSVNFFVVQIDAGGIGLNLQAASRVYLNGCHWNGVSEVQAIARAHRIGQTRPVTVKRLLINDSIDDAIIQIQQKKFACAADVLGDERIKHSLKAHKPNSDFKTLIETVFK